MAYDIAWTAEAEDDFTTIVKYLIANWSRKSADKFISHTYKKLERLSAMPSVAPHTSKKSIFMYQLDRKNVFFFSIEENHLVLLSIYPYKKDITKSAYY